MLKELIKALYEIVKAIKGDENGSSVSSNGLLGADAVACFFGSNPEPYIFYSLDELYEQINGLGGDNFGFFSGYPPQVTFLYKKDNIDLLNKPRNAQLGNGYVIPSEVGQEANVLTGNMQIYFCTQFDIDQHDAFLTKYQDTDYYYIELD